MEVLLKRISNLAMTAQGRNSFIIRGSQGNKSLFRRLRYNRIFVTVKLLFPADEQHRRVFAFFDIIPEYFCELSVAIFEKNDHINVFSKSEIKVGLGRKVSIPFTILVPPDNLRVLLQRVRHIHLSMIQQVILDQRFPLL